MPPSNLMASSHCKQTDRNAVFFVPFPSVFPSDRMPPKFYNKPYLVIWKTSRQKAVNNGAAFVLVPTAALICFYMHVKVKVVKLNIVISSSDQINGARCELLLMFNAHWFIVP